VHGTLGSALVNPATGYSFVYHIEMYLLFATLIALGPLVRRSTRGSSSSATEFGLAEFRG
jgi:BCD family chlorophyll transporter-like MFS transporter